MNDAVQPDARNASGSAQRGMLLQIQAACPHCGARPALRVTTDVMLALAHLAGETRVGTYQCQRRQCGRIYDLSAAHYQNAS